MIRLPCFTRILRFQQRRGLSNEPQLADFIRAASLGQKHPQWLKSDIPRGETTFKVNRKMNQLGLNTVCREAKCPNLGECWSRGTATIMLLGDECTRACRFCAVKTSRKPSYVPSIEEARNTAQAISDMNLKYVVLTSVDRDDLPDHGSEHFEQTVREVKTMIKNIRVECLTPDFGGNVDCISRVARSGLDVFAHNVETVKELQKLVRDPRANFDQSLLVLTTAKSAKAGLLTKTSLMLGLGETDDQIRRVMDSLRRVDVDILTFGQYLQPTKRHLRVKEFVHPDKFDKWRQVGEEEFGFRFVASAPMVRSSYKAEEGYEKAKRYAGQVTS